MIVACGEAVVDFLPVRSAVGERAYAPRPGGAPFNVAIAVARLGAPAAFFGGLSTDAFGTMLAGALAATGVDVGFAPRVPRPSTLAFVSFTGGGEDYAFFDEASAGRMLTEADLPTFPATVTALHFGSLSLAEEPCGSAFEALMRRERRDRVITLDPNVRARMIQNRGGYLARIDRMVAMSDVVRLSRADLAYLAPGADFAALAAGWLDRGAKLVVLTDGPRNIEARTRSASATATPPAVNVVDTIGAGDAFMGALLAHWHEAGRLTKRGIAGLSGSDLGEALAFAARAAAISVTRAGAEPARWQELR